MAIKDTDGIVKSLFVALTRCWDISETSYDDIRYITITCLCNELQFFIAWKFSDEKLFLIFAQNLECVYTLEPPH